MGNFLQKDQQLYSTLNDDLLTHCQQITGFTEDEIRFEHERFFYIAPDGRLKKLYVEELLGDHIPNTKWKHIKYLIDCLFAAIDANSDGSIDFLEYLMSRKFFQTDSPREKADFIFRIIDRNGDNIVSKKDLERILACLEDYHRHSSNLHVIKMINGGVKPTADRILHQLDEDHSGLIDRTEFIQGWLNDETIRALFTF